MSARPAAQVRLRPIALPTEHGGWGLVLMPIILGLGVAPSWAGLWIGLAALAVFLVRQPLKLAIGDWRGGKRFARTRWALLFALAYGAAALACVAAAWAAGARPCWEPLLLAAPLALVQFWHDTLKQSRALLAELCGAAAISAVAAIIARAQGWALAPACALWLLQALQACAAIVYVRTRIRLARGVVVPRAPAIWLHVAALGAVLALAWWRLVPALSGVAFAILAARAWAGLRPQALALPIPRVGMQEVGYSLVVVVMSILGVHMAF
ncbi:YwiC-like family protein [Chloroflexia bacterium SDU3-3]|nr:YwiC-like family protein [Chloroflexia bacterium SDU3-3]